MFNISSKNEGFSMNVRYRDFFIDFFACLLPGIVFLMTIIIIALGLLHVFLNGINISIYNNINSVEAFSNTICKFLSMTFWTQILLLITAYVLGFVLYRQDPKRPDYVSYIRNRKALIGYSPWVIKKSSGLNPREVQFPYDNLRQYLSYRGFSNLSNYIYWEKIEDSKEEIEKSTDRSKAFINKLKMRISFYFPESTFSIVKNEGHIRFSSSMWYGLSILIKFLYVSLTLYLVYLLFVVKKMSINGNSVKNLFLIIIGYISITIIIYVARKSVLYMQKINHKGDEKTITIYCQIISIILVIFDFFPVIMSFSLLLFWYSYLSANISIGLDDAITLSFIYASMWYISTLLVIAFGCFYVKYKIEVSFHYQRVREIIYVLETANISKVINDIEIESLWTQRTGNEIGNLNINLSKTMPAKS